MKKRQFTTDAQWGYEGKIKFAMKKTINSELIENHGVVDDIKILF